MTTLSAYVVCMTQALISKFKTLQSCQLKFRTFPTAVKIRNSESLAATLLLAS